MHDLTDYKNYLQEYFYGTHEGVIATAKDLVSNTNQKKQAIERLEGILTSQFKRRLADDRSINFLDVGCGAGHLTSLMATMLSKYFTLNRQYLIDPSKLLLSVCKENMTSLPCNACNLVYKQNGLYHDKTLSEILDGESFDIILCSHIFFWVDDWKSALQQLWQVLRPGGVIFIIIISRDADPIEFEFRNALFHQAHEGSSIYMETAEDLIQQAVKSNRLTTACKEEPFLSDMKFPWADYENIVSPANKITINVLEFLLRKPWKDISVHARKRILAQLNERMEGNNIRVKIPEKILWVEKL